jgi:predicted DNA repair protein MutK
MAGASLLTLFDDIATILDDVAAMTKVAARKTAGVLGDDLALNAEQVSGVKADRELPVVWAVCKGSLINKLILVPAALAISALVPWLIIPLLMLGGAFLCYEGAEKVLHKFFHKAEDQAHKQELLEAVAVKSPEELMAMERAKIKGAIRTDFILSAEIIVITLGTVANAAFGTRVAVVAGIALIMTLGVYGLVAGIVKIDDVGLWLSRKTNAAAQAIGRGLLAFAPWLMKVLTVVGTLAMFLVGGGILAHGVHAIQHWFDGLFKTANAAIPYSGSMLSFALPGVLGLLAGLVLVLVISNAQKAWATVRA